MSPATTTTLAGKPTGKDETQSSATRKPSSSRPHEPPVKCPRCDSPNTKFCYYNNYSLSQPRHFCKTCRRYWTKGGALRNVPIGGGCRKNKKLKSSSPADSKDSTASSSDAAAAAAFKFFQPAMDFQLGRINMPKLHTPIQNTTITTNNIFHHFPSFADSSAIPQTQCFNLDPSFCFPLSSSAKQGENTSGFQNLGSVNVHGNLASSIESLSSINQDLHWKLQQQRLATLFVEDGQKEASGNIEKPQSIQFQSLENHPKTDSCLNSIGTSRKDVNFSNNEWFLNNSYSAAAATTPATASGSNLNGNWSGGVQAWTSELTQYTSLP